MELFIVLLLGVTLSASCGFRIFVPPLILALSQRFGFIELPNALDWAQSNTALIVLAIATLIEVLAYYIPVVDNFMDTISVPGAFIVGTLVMGSFVNFDQEVFNWVAAAVAGGASAGLISFGTSAVRGLATTTTGGVANSVFSTLELVGSVLLSVLTIFLPVTGIILLVLIIFLAFRYYQRRGKRKLQIIN